MFRTHRRIKKAVNSATAFIIVMLIVVSMSITPGFAYTSQSLGEITCENDVYNGNEKICDRIADGMKNLQDEILIDDLKLPSTQFSDVIVTVIRKHPELFYVNSSKITAMGRNGYIIAIYPTYIGDNDTIAEQVATFNKKVDSIMNKIDSSMSDYEKAIVLHDEIALNCKYDDDSVNSERVSAYNALVNGASVCQGYAEAYSYLLSLAGISSEFVESSSMNHAWNKVCIDGVYYNVDVTWDDPIYDKAGHVQHDYFLLSDEAIGSDHYGYNSRYSSDSKKYDSYLMHEIDTKFCFVEGDCYIIDNNSGSEYEKCLLKYNTATEQVEIIERLDYVWSAGENRYWLGGFMSLDEYNDILYYNTPDSVIKYDPESDEKEIIHTDANLSGTYYGLLINDNNIYVNIKDNPNEEGILSRLDISLGTDEPEPATSEPTTEPVPTTKPQPTTAPVPTTDPQPTTTPVPTTKPQPTTTPVLTTDPQPTTIPDDLLLGDVDMSGKITILDATEIQKHLAGLVILTPEQLSVADFNGDGRINILDATAIQYYLVR